MIIEVDDNSGEARTYKNLDAFAYAHRTELEDKYRKMFAPKVEVCVNNIDDLQALLPKDCSPIKRINSWRGDIVVNCKDGEVHTLRRSGEYPYYYLYK